MADKGTAQIKVRVDASNAKTEIKNLNNELQQMSKYAKQAGQDLDKIGNKKIKDPTANIQKGLKDTKTKTAQLEQQLQKLGTLKIKDVTVDLRNGLSKTETQANKTKKAIQGLGVGRVKDTTMDLRSGLSKTETQARNTKKTINSIGTGQVKDNTVNLRSGLSKTETQAKNTRKEVRSIGTAQIKDPTEKAQVGLRSYNRKITDTKQNIKSLDNIKVTGPYKELNDDVTKVNSNIRKTSTELKKVDNIKISDPFTKIESGADKASANIKGLHGNLMGMQQLFSDTAGIVGGAVTSYGDLNGVVRETTYQFSQMEDSTNPTAKSLDEVQQMGGKTADQLQQLNTFAGLTSFSVQDTADSMLEMAKSGLDAQASTDIVSSGMMAADLNGQDLETTIHDVSGTINAFGGNLKSAKDPGDMFTTTLDKMQFAADATASDLSDLTAGFKYLAPVASNAGASFDDTVVVLAALGDAGLEASKGARVLSSGLQNITAPTAKAQAAMDDMGVSVYDANGKFRGLLPVLKDMQKGTEDMTDAQRMNALTAVFGKTAIKSWGSVLNMNLDSLEDTVKGTNAASDGLGYMTTKFFEVKAGIPKEQLEEWNKELKNSGTEAEASAKKNDILREAWKSLVENNPAAAIDMVTEKLGNFATMMGGQLTQVLVNIATVVVPQMQQAFQVFTDTVNDVREAMGLSSIGSQELATDMSTLLLTVGLLAGGTAALVDIIGALSGAFIGLAAAAAVGKVLADMDVTLADLTQKFLDLIMPTSDFDKAVLGLATGSLANLIKSVLNLINDCLGPLHDMIYNLVIPAISALMEILSTIIDVFDILIDKVPGFSGLLEAGVASWIAYKAVVKPTTDALKTFKSTVTNLIEVIPKLAAKMGLLAKAQEKVNESSNRAGDGLDTFNKKAGKSSDPLKNTGKVGVGAMDDVAGASVKTGAAIETSMTGAAETATGSFLGIGTAAAAGIAAGATVGLAATATAWKTFNDQVTTANGNAGKDNEAIGQAYADEVKRQQADIDANYEKSRKANHVSDAQYKKMSVEEQRKVDKQAFDDAQKHQKDLDQIQAKAQAAASTKQDQINAERIAKQQKHFEASSGMAQAQLVQTYDAKGKAEKDYNAKVTAYQEAFAKEKQLRESNANQESIDKAASQTRTAQEAMLTSETDFENRKKTLKDVMRQQNLSSETEAAQKVATLKEMHNSAELDAYNQYNKKEIEINGQKYDAFVNQQGKYEAYTKDANGKEVSLYEDSKGHMVQITKDANGKMQKSVIDSQGKILSVTDLKGKEAAAATKEHLDEGAKHYQDNGNKVATTVKKNGDIITKQEKANGVKINTTVKQNGDKIVETIQKDGSKQVKTTKDNGTKINNQVAKDGSKVVTTTDTNGKKVVDSYDKTGRKVTSKVTGNGHDTVTAYDKTGDQIIQSTDDTGKLMVTKTDKNGLEQNRIYQKNGEVMISTTDSNGEETNRVLANKFDLMNGISDKKWETIVATIAKQTGYTPGQVEDAISPVKDKFSTSATDSQNNFMTNLKGLDGAIAAYVLGIKPPTIMFPWDYAKESKSSVPTDGSIGPVAPSGAPMPQQSVASRTLSRTFGKARTLTSPVSRNLGSGYGATRNTIQSSTVLSVPRPSTGGVVVQFNGDMNVRSDSDLNYIAGVVEDTVVKAMRGAR